MIKEQCVGFLRTPPLWTKEQFGIRQFTFPTLDINGLTPEPIQGKLRLGHQMEHVFYQLIQNSGKYTILVYNLPIKMGNRTIGEIDFILRDKITDHLIHVELTYKFYILDFLISEPIHRLMGPNRRDMFFTKMEKIKNQQFELLHGKEGIEALSKLKIDHTIISHQACFKAQLFAPFKMKSIPIRPLNKACVAGYWLQFDEFSSREFHDHSYYIPYKSQWVVAPHEAVEWHSHFEILLEINIRMLKQNAPMVWLRKSTGEFEKFFVVWW
ncbi:MAG: DUF1853 family protein [Pricia sp.]|nr:DUF1853 family protein [Pricia sp.]